MSQRLRGQEATLRVTVDGVGQDGSWFKVKDFTITPRTDITETPYVGEQEDDLDIQHHGLDISFSVDMQDRKTLDFLSTIIAREQDQLVHPVITINVIYAFRGQQRLARHRVSLQRVPEGVGARRRRPEGIRQRELRGQV